MPTLGSMIEESAQEMSLSAVDQENLRIALLEIDSVEQELQRRRRENGIVYFIPNHPQKKALHDTIAGTVSILVEKEEVKKLGDVGAPEIP